MTFELDIWHDDSLSVYMTGMYQQAILFSSFLKFDLQAAVSAYVTVF